MKARTIAEGKCYACGGAVTVAEVADGGPTRQMVMHVQPPCAHFISSDSDAFARQCKLASVDEIAEAFDDLLK